MLKNYLLIIKNVDLQMDMGVEKYSMKNNF